MKASEIIRLLKKAGCYIIRNGRNHDIWYSPATGVQFEVPRHKSKELATGTADSILKDAGLK